MTRTSGGQKKNDPVFGDVTYKYGWLTSLETSLFGKTFSIDCIASAYTGQDILEEQREAYKSFLHNQAAVERNICEALQEYRAESPAQVKPTALVFQRDGSWGMLFDCDWDEEHGVAVCIYPELKVGPQDMFL